MRIGELSQQTGIPASTLRYYERIGLIDPPHRISGQREYDEDIVDTLRLIQLAKRNAFSLEDIRDILATEQSRARLWRDIAGQKLAEIQEQIIQFQAIEKTLTASINCECNDLSTCDLIV